MNSTLITVFGNEIRADDGLPFSIIDNIADKFSNTDIIKTSESGLNLIDIFDGYKKIIVLDTIKDKNRHTGDVFHYKHSINYKNLSGSAHNIGVMSIPVLYKDLGMDIPDYIDFILINISENDCFKNGYSTDYSPAEKKVETMIMKLITG